MRSLNLKALSVSTTNLAKTDEDPISQGNDNKLIETNFDLTDDLLVDDKSPVTNVDIQNQDSDSPMQRSWFARHAKIKLPNHFESPKD